jgi:cytochrome c biogenesis protein CcmG, thiol:disulfide interchange protein DsbE
MTHSKVDQAIKIGIGVLTLALAFVIVYTMQDHIVKEGDRAPNFTITTDSGKQISPRDFGGKVLVLNFWATWCGPCVQEAPSLSQFQRMLASSGVVVLGISVDRRPDLYKNFIQRFRLPFPTARDPEENISASYGTVQFPESYIIDRNGKVVRKYAGLPDRNGQAIPWTDPELVAYVKSLL